MDSKVNDNDVVSANIEIRKESKDFPITFMDFLNMKAEECTHKASSDTLQSKVNVLATDEVKKYSLITSPSKESPDLEIASHSDEEEYLPTYKSLFERIKRQSSDESLFKPKYSPGRQKEKPINATDSENDALLTGKTSISCEGSEDNLTETKQIRDISDTPMNLKSLSTVDAVHSVVQSVSRTIADNQRENMPVEDPVNKGETSTVKQMGIHTDNVGLNTKNKSNKGNDVHTTFMDYFSPITFIDFLNAIDVGNTKPSNICNDGQSTDLLVEKCLETSELETASHSDDEEYLPTYTNLFERIKRQSSDDNFFKSKFSLQKQAEKLMDTSLCDSDITLTGESCMPSNCDNSLDEKINISPTKLKSLITTKSTLLLQEAQLTNTPFSNSDTSSRNTYEGRPKLEENKISYSTVSPTQLKLSNSTDAAQSVTNTLVDNPSANMTFEDPEDRLKIIDKPASLITTDTSQGIKSEQPATLKGTYTSHDVKSEHPTSLKRKYTSEDVKSEHPTSLKGKYTSQDVKLEHPAIKGKYTSQDVKSEHPTSLKGKYTSQDIKSEHEVSNSETFPEINLSYIERFCYKAMVFQQTGEVPVDCNSETTEPHSSDQDLGPKPKNPLPCLCRFYSKKKCKNDKVKSPSYKRPCQIGKGYPSDRNKIGHSSCACKVLPNSKAFNKLLGKEIGESSNTNPVAIYNAVAINETNEPTVGVVKSLKRKKAGRHLAEKVNPDEDDARKYLDNLALKTKLLAKLEMSEKRLKRLTDYDSNLSLVSDHMVPILEDRNQSADLMFFSHDDSPDKCKENVPLPPPETRNLDPCIDLTSDSPPNFPYRSNQAKSVEPKDNPDYKEHESKRKKLNLRRSGATKGAIYVSDSSDEDVLVKNKEQKAKSSEMKLMSANGKDSKQHAKLLVQPMKYRNSGVMYITDSEEEDPVNSTPTRREISRNLGTASTLSAPSYLATEPPHSIAVERSIRSTYEHNIPQFCTEERDSNMPIPQSAGSADDQSCNPVPSGSKVSVPGKSSSSIVFSNVEPIDIDDDYDPESSIYEDTQSGMTYADLLESYAAYESDDDWVSIVMGSPGSPSRDEDLLITTEVDKVVPVTPQVEVDYFVNLTLPEPPTSNATRVLRTRTVPRLTQSMVPVKRAVKKEPVCSTEPLIPVSNAAVQDEARLSVVKPMGRPKRHSLRPPSTSVPSVKKTKSAVVTECGVSDNQSTPESTKLKREILAMQAQLKEVSALAAKAAQHEREAKAAKEKEMLALQKAREANEKLREERLLRDREKKENFLKAENIKKIEKEAKAAAKAAKEKEARDKEQAKREAQEKAWECPVCFEPRSASTQLSTTPCGHVFCKPCILEVGSTKKSNCPLCNRPFTASQVTPLFFNFPM